MPNYVKLRKKKKGKKYSYFEALIKLRQVTGGEKGKGRKDMGTVYCFAVTREAYKRPDAGNEWQAGKVKGNSHLHGT